VRYPRYVYAYRQYLHDETNVGEVKIYRGIT